MIDWRIINRKIAMKAITLALVLALVGCTEEAPEADPGTVRISDPQFEQFNSLPSVVFKVTNDTDRDIREFYCTMFSANPVAGVSSWYVFPLLEAGADVIERVIFSDFKNVIVTSVDFDCRYQTGGETRNIIGTLR